MYCSHESFRQRERDGEEEAYPARGWRESKKQDEHQECRCLKDKSENSFKEEGVNLPCQMEL